VRTLTFGDTPEPVWERADFPPDRIKAILGKDTLAVLGYGPQGRGQALNARDNGVNVVIGLREGGSSYAEAVKDG
jgi:ketol-acid reductoisomerase